MSETRLGAAGALAVLSLVFLVAHGFRPDMIVNPSPGAVRHWIAATFLQVSRVGGGGGVGGGAVLAPGRFGELSETDAVTISYENAGAYVSLVPDVPDLTYTPAPLAQRVWGAPPQAHSDQLPPAPADPGDAWRWTVQAVRLGRPSSDIIRDGRHLWGQSVRTWERRISKVKRELRENGETLP